MPEQRSVLVLFVEYIDSTHRTLSVVVFCCICLDLYFYDNRPGSKQLNCCVCTRFEKLNLETVAVRVPCSPACLFFSFLAIDFDFCGGTFLWIRTFNKSRNKSVFIPRCGTIEVLVFTVFCHIRIFRTISEIQTIQTGKHTPRRGNVIPEFICSICACDS